MDREPVFHEGFWWRRQPDGVIEWAEEPDGEWGAWEPDESVVSAPASLHDPVPDEGMKPRTKWILAAVAVVLVIAGIDASNDPPPDDPDPVAQEDLQEEVEDDQEPDPAPEPEQDAGSRPPCEHFRNVIADAQAGVLTDAELRDKIVDIEDSAAVATAEVQRAATELLAAVTRGKPRPFVQAVGEMSAACSDAGW